MQLFGQDFPMRVTKSTNILLTCPVIMVPLVEPSVPREYGGDWAMAQFILATETGDEAECNARMAEIRKYNQEDLAATWAVFKWLRSEAGVAQAPASTP